MSEVSGWLPFEGRIVIEGGVVVTVVMVPRWWVFVWFGAG